MVPVDAKQAKAVLSADRLDSGKVSVVIRTNPKSQVTQLAGHLHVAALAKRTKATDSPVAVALQISDQTDNHQADPHSQTGVAQDVGEL
jgi:hypothetical protein